ncbi:calcium-binding protein [Pantanalinema sp. GBBB05]|uniref:calcium-binding protein n=1 Tax=Pantanalinema sp. GBBB05 TaxID=2604139 RepID=UPI001D8EA212|nr:calcium-binding protein [Pantanalinema sp. GBBB05]
MPQLAQDDDREQRIAMQVFVDIYEEAEAGLSWYYYLQHRVQFPFKAHWIKNRHQASLTAGEVVEVIGLPHEEDCEREMLVNIRYREEELEDEFAVPLANIVPIEADAETQEAIADWHYWVDMGYGLGEAAV